MELNQTDKILHTKRTIPIGMVPLCSSSSSHALQAAPRNAISNEHPKPTVIVTQHTKKYYNIFAVHLSAVWGHTSQ